MFDPIGMKKREEVSDPKKLSVHAVGKFPLIIHPFVKKVKSVCKKNDAREVYDQQKQEKYSILVQKTI